MDLGMVLKVPTDLRQPHLFLVVAHSVKTPAGMLVIRRLAGVENLSR